MRAMPLFIVVVLWMMSAGATAAAKDRVVFWTTEMERERLAVQERLAQRFTADTGIHVSVVPVHENRMCRAALDALHAASLPDVVYHPIAFSIGWMKAGVLDARAATQVVKALDSRTFAKGVLGALRVPGGFAAVPMDGWRQFLLYRKDLFHRKGLPAPDNWDRILNAAKTLHHPPSLWGIMVPTAPGHMYTQQVFEHLASSNGVRLANTSGQVDLTIPEMVQTLKFYRKLCRFTPGGDISWQHTRNAYIAGRTAMILWSPFILDELSGLRSDLQVIPDLIAGKTGYLASNTGFISLVHGLNGSAQYSQINGIGITQSAAKGPAIEWVRFLLSDGYLNWLAMAPEGKLPMRTGTRHKPDYFINAWMGLKIGPGLEARISDLYGEAVLKKIVSHDVVNSSQWGLSGENQDLALKLYDSGAIPNILRKYLDGKIDAAQAAGEINTLAQTLAK